MAQTILMRLFLAGDVMLGRGIDQIFRWPGDDRLYESYVKSARDYVRMAEETSGSIPRDTDLSYVWGHAADAIAAEGEGPVIINLETAITTRGTPEPKGINYRVTPRNAGGLKDLGIGCCVLANNHVLDWGVDGLRDTLDTLDGQGLAHAGAGLDAEAAARPAILPAGRGRVLVFAFAAEDSGVPWNWRASAEGPGVNLLVDFGGSQVAAIAAQVANHKRENDIAVASIHWGGNWGHNIPDAHRSFAYALIHRAGIDVIHGHSSHHPKGWEIHNGKLILYGCGDLINDYEGIVGHNAYRSELTAIYVPEIAADGQLLNLTVIPFHMRKFRLNRATADERSWLCEAMNRHGKTTDMKFEPSGDGVCHLVRR